MRLVCDMCRCASWGEIFDEENCCCVRFFKLIKFQKECIDTWKLDDVKNFEQKILNAKIIEW